MNFISVIIPAFNSERWLDNTLRSVYEAIDAECEVIIVNDGSTDNTHEISRRYVDKDPRFTMIDIEHVGPCAARKAGFLESQGDYVMFVDSDDILPRNAISEQRKLIDSCEKGMEGVRTDGAPKIVLANTFVQSGQKEFLLISGERRALTGMEYVYEILRRSLPGFFPGHLYARDIVEAIEWDDSPEITHQENFYLLLSLAMKLNELAPEKRQVLVAPSVIGYRYIRRAGSQSALMALTPRGLERVWSHLCDLKLPEPEFTLWGLEVLNRVFIERGIPFASNFSMAVNLRKRAAALGKDLPENYRPIVDALGSLKKRTRIAKEMARTAGLTSIRPHLSVILISNHNMSKVDRTVASVFDMGFRNLEVVVVDMAGSHADRVALNQLSIRYARVRVVKVDSDNMYSAAVAGLKAAEGLCTAYVRAGDLCCAAGLYDAVTRIDYGADAVLPNFRDYYPLLKIHGKLHSYSYLRSNEDRRNAAVSAADSTENVYKAVVKMLNDDDPKQRKLLLAGIVWRTDFLKNNVPNPVAFRNMQSPTITQALFMALIKIHVRIVTQDKNGPASFEFVKSNAPERFLSRLIKGKNRASNLPSYYK